MVSSENNSVLLLGCGAAQVPFIEALHEDGYRVFGVDRDPRAPGGGLVDRFANISSFDADAILQATADTELSGVIAYSAFIECQRAAAVIRKERHLPGPDLAPLKDLLSKASWQRKLELAGVAIPSQTGVTAQQRWNGPVIVKPASDGFGSAGIQRFDTLADAHSSLGDSATEWHIEPFLDGNLFNVGGVVSQGRVSVLSLCKKSTLDNLVTSGFCSVSVNDAIFAGILNVAINAITALELDDTAFSVDVIRHAEGDAVIDTGCMLDARVDRLLAAAGVPVYLQIVRACLGQPVQAGVVLEAGWALDFAFADRAGQLEHIEVDQGTLQLEKTAGAQVQPPRSIADCLAYTIYRPEAADGGRPGWTVQINSEAA